MRNMKDSGIEWIGEIPQDWKILKLKNIAKIQTGNTPSKNDGVNYYSEKGTMWVKPDNLNNLEPINETKEYLNDSGRCIARVVPPKTPLVCCIGSIGKVGYSDKEVAFNQQINSVEFNNNCNWKFGLYSLIANEHQHWLYSNGNVLKILNNQGQGNINLSLPQIEEQELIADYLDSKVKEIDNIISKTKETIDEYKKYKQSVITEAVTKGLNPNVEMKDSGIEWIGDIPQDWNIIRLRFLCDICTGNKDTVNKEDDGVYPFYVRSPKVEKINSYSFDGEAILTAGDGVGAGKVFHYVNGKFDYHQRVYNLHNFSKNINTRLLYYYLKENFYKEIEKGNAKSTVDSIRLNMLQNFPVIIPNKQQEDIVKYLDKKCNEIDKLISKKEQLITELEQYKKSLIYECVTGKKEVSVSYAY